MLQKISHIANSDIFWNLIDDEIWRVGQFLKKNIDVIEQTNRRNSASIKLIVFIDS